jgi:Domain of unknown function (DUF4331)
MKSLRVGFLFETALIALVFAFFMAFPPSAVAADHRDAPIVDGIPEGDITDVYVFTDLNDSSRVVMIMNVNPFTVPAESGSYSFSPDLLYQIKIDNTGNAREDLVIQITFDTTGQTQTARVVGPARPRMTGARNLLLKERPSATGKFGTMFGDPNGVMAFVGLRDDPFVFDFGQFTRILNNTQDLFRQVGNFRGRSLHADGTSGVDAFGGFDVTSIALSVPKSMIRGASSRIGVWATVSQRASNSHDKDRKHGGDDDDDEPFIQFERMAQQAFATVFIPKPMRDAENAEIPEHDVANYSGLIPDALTITDNDGTGNTIAARVGLLNTLGVTSLPNGAPLLLPANFPNKSKELLRAALLPDVLRLDLDLPAEDQAIGQFGLQNGRRLNDPSVDILLQLARQLSDLHLPAPLPGSGPIGSRVPLECSNFPNCQDRRILVVLQGTDWIKPDNEIADTTIEGNDRPFLTQFPYIATPHPVPGEPGTVGFPPQQ